MGFREYNPGLNRFLTRDMFNGALQDLALGTDPWNANRYMFGGGNPISRIELNGHYAIEDNSDRFEPHDTPTITSPTTTGSTGGSTTPAPNNVGQEINQSMGLPAGASQQQQAIRMAQMGINPTIAGLKLGAEEFNKSGLPEYFEQLAELSGGKDLEECAMYFGPTSCGMTTLMILPIGKVGKGVSIAAEEAGPHLALGLTSKGGKALLAPFAERVGALTWKTEPYQSMWRGTTSSAVKNMIDDVVSRNGRVSFNLEGIDGMDQILRGETKGLRTPEELHYICNSPAARSITTFFGGAAPC